MNILEIAKSFGIPLDSDFQFTPNFWKKPMMYMCANVLEPGTCNTHLGLYQLDANWNLVNYFMSQFFEREVYNPRDGQKLNAILVNGDHNAHGVTYPNYVMFNYKNQNGNFTDLHNRMDKIKKNWTKFYSLVFNTTKNQIPVLPTFGNNDMVVHSQDNSPELNKYYYPLIFDIWFSKQDAKPVDPEPFFDGGYYRYDFENRDLSLLAMNTVMYMSGNREFTSAMQNQMDWIEKNLKENAQLPVESRKQFMISMHVFPGLNYFNHVEPLWLLEWQDKFLSILDTYGEQVIMI